MANEMSGATPNWGKAVLAGIVATVAITITMLLQGNNILLNLGGMMMPDAGDGAKYVVGGIVHFMVGIVYALIFAALLGRASLPQVVKGVLFGLATAAIALSMMPIVAQMMPGGGAGNPCAAAGNPCNPCAGKAENPCNPCAGKAGNPCNPCAGKAENPCNPCAGKAENPCNPCAGKAGNPCNPCAGKAENPCNPCAGKVENPCNPCAGKAGNPCAAGNPCNPCGGGGDPYGGLWSVIHHLVYGLVLAFVYKE